MPQRLIGRTLGKYRVEALLGTGGFAWVYAASDPDLEVVVALKVLKPQYSGNPDFEARFRREASTAARLRHPNIIKIYTVGREDSDVYFAMDLYSQKLAQQIGVMGALPESAVIKLGLDVASALAFAHRQGVIHRDIKADNILFDDHGNAVVADFGIARAATADASQTGTNIIIGTPQYFAPEQARGKNLDSRADIYSLGVTLFTASTGQLPFTGDDWYEIATKHVHETPPRPSEKNPAISPELERIILKCLEKDRENRYQTAELLFADLESLARTNVATNGSATMVVSTPVTGRFRTIDQPPPKQPSRITAAAVMFAAFVAATGVFAAVQNRYAPVQHGGLPASGVVAGGPTTQLPGSGIGAGDSSVTGVVQDSGAGGVNDPARGRGADPLPTPRFLFTVSAAEDAAILINGLQVGRGSWQTDTMKPGNYRVEATVPGFPQCKWARQATLASMSGSGPGNVSLQPRRCGSMMLIATHNGAVVDASFQVRSRDGGDLLLEDRVPAAAPFLLPTGTHRLVVTAPLCQTFDDVVVIAADSTTRRFAPLFCGNP